MAGCHTWGGTNSAPACSPHTVAASKFSTIWWWFCPSATATGGRCVVLEKQPEVMPPEVVPKRWSTCPVKLRPLSVDHAPDTFPLPGAQFRKNLWHLRNYRPELDFWECRKSFRTWTLGAEDAGATNQPGLPEISGSFAVRGTMINDNSVLETTGAFLYTNTSYDERFASFQVSSNLSSQGCTFNAARNNTIYGASPTVMPASVNLPAILYLGRPA